MTSFKVRGVVLLVDNSIHWLDKPPVLEQVDGTKSLITYVGGVYLAGNEQTLSDIRNTWPEVTDAYWNVMQRIPGQGPHQVTFHVTTDDHSVVSVSLDDVEPFSV